MSFEIPPVYPFWLQAPNGHQYWILTQDDQLTFGVKEVAWLFFKRSGSWLRGRLQPEPENPRHPKGWFTEEDINVALSVNWAEGSDADYRYRRFTLYDIERMLWSMYRHDRDEIVFWYRSIEQTGKRAEDRLSRYNDRIEAARRHLEIGLGMVKWMGRQFGLVPMPGAEDIFYPPPEEHVHTPGCDQTSSLQGKS